MARNELDHSTFVDPVCEKGRDVEVLTEVLSRFAETTRLERRFLGRGDREVADDSLDDGLSVGREAVEFKPSA